jgi:hypothetical protein
MALCTVLTQQLQVAIRRLGGTIMVLCPITSLAIRCIMMAPRPRPSSHLGRARMVRTPARPAVAASGTPAPSEWPSGRAREPGWRFRRSSSPGLCNNPEPSEAGHQRATLGSLAPSESAEGLS